MSDDDRRPPAARRYDPEHEELNVLVHRLLVDPDPEGEGWRDLSFWLDTTLAKHRMEARSEGLTEAWRGTWWDRNWFALAFLGMVGGVLLLIGFINGWS